MPSWRPVQLDRPAEQAVTGIVDDIFDIRARGGDCRGRSCRRNRASEITGDQQRLGPACGGDLAASAVRRSARRAVSARR